ncbi:MAG: hypothetical protein ACOC1G_05240 [Phycisphaeraceae bacterium]
MQLTTPCWLAAISDIEPMVWLLPVVAIYAAWRAVVYAKQKRWAIFIPVVFIIAICLYEFALQLYRNLGEDAVVSPRATQIDGDPGGSAITAPADHEPTNDAGDDHNDVDRDGDAQGSAP